MKFSDEIFKFQLCIDLWKSSDQSNSKKLFKLLQKKSACSFLEKNWLNLEILKMITLNGLFRRLLDCNPNVRSQLQKPT